jgi:integrase
LKELGKVGDGVDPAEERRAARAGETKKELAEVYIARELKHHKTAADTERRIRKHIIPALGTRRVKDVTTPDVARLHHRIGDRTPIEANRVREILHRMFECARKWGYTDRDRINPVADVDRFKQRSRDRFASEDELPYLWRAIEAETDENVRAAFRLILLTGCRKNEVLALRWRDVDLRGRELRLPDTKNGKPAVVPLSPEAVDVLRELDRGTPDAPLFPVSTVKRAWNRVRARAWLYANPDEERRLRVHELRATFSSALVFWIEREAPPFTGLARLRRTRVMELTKVRSEIIHSQITALLTNCIGRTRSHPLETMSALSTLLLDGSAVTRGVRASAAESRTAVSNARIGNKTRLCCFTHAPHPGAACGPITGSPRLPGAAVALRGARGRRRCWHIFRSEPERFASSGLLVPAC